MPAAFTTYLDMRLKVVLRSSASLQVSDSVPFCLDLSLQREVSCRHLVRALRRAQSGAPPAGARDSCPAVSWPTHASSTTTATTTSTAQERGTQILGSRNPTSPSGRCSQRHGGGGGGSSSFHQLTRRRPHGCCRGCCRMECWDETRRTASQSQRHTRRQRRPPGSATVPREQKHIKKAWAPQPSTNHSN